MQVPSIGFIRDDGEVIVGEAAEPEGAADPSRVVREFKRRTGDPVPLVVDGSPFSAQALTARLLAWVIGIATERQGGPPEHVCVTHPANWGPVKRDLLGQAITMAGLRGAETSTRTEPEAAAIAYASRDRVAEGDRVALACSRTSSRISCANCRTRPSATSGRRRSEPRFYDINAERGTVAAISGGVLDSASGLERGPVPCRTGRGKLDPALPGSGHPSARRLTPGRSARRSQGTPTRDKDPLLHRGEVCWSAHVRRLLPGRSRLPGPTRNRRALHELPHLPLLLDRGGTVPPRFPGGVIPAAPRHIDAGNRQGRHIGLLGVGCVPVRRGNCCPSDGGGWTPTTIMMRFRCS